MSDEIVDTTEPVVEEAELTELEKLEAQYPEHLRTRFGEIDLTCPKCQSIWHPGVANFINSDTHPGGREGILRQTIHKSRCPACKGYQYDINQIFDYYIPEENLIVQVRPAWELRAGGEDYYWARMEDLVMRYAEDDVHVDLCFGLDEMIEKHLGGEEAVEQAMARRQREIDLRQAPGSIVSEEAYLASFTEEEPEVREA